MPDAPADRRLRLLRQAEAELNKAADQYDERRPGLGDRFVSAVDRAIETIVIAPPRWPRVDAKHHRALVHRFPFSIIYRFDDAEIIIVAVAHHRKRPAYWSRRRWRRRRTRPAGRGLQRWPLMRRQGEGPTAAATVGDGWTSARRGSGGPAEKRTAAPPPP